MEIVIKKTTDWESAYKIAELFHGDFFTDQGLADIKKAVQQDTLIGAFIEDQMVGFLTFSEYSNDVVELSWMAVKAEYQNQGTGSMLIEQGLGLLDKGYKVCKVKTLGETAEDAGYEKTRNFYSKHGFFKLEEIDPFPGWGEGTPCVILIKLLDPRSSRG